LVEKFITVLEKLPQVLRGEFFYSHCIVLYRTCTGQPAVWGFVSLGAHCDRVFLFSEVHLLHGGNPRWVWSLFWSVAGQLFLQYFDAVGWVF